MILNCKIGQGTKIPQGHLVNLYECKIGQNCMIGAFVEIQKGVVIGDNCRIQSHVFICEGVTIEDDVFIGHGVMFVNDLHPKANKPFELKKTLIKQGTSIGNNATILPVIIGENCLVGAGTIVTKDIPDNTIIRQKIDYIHHPNL